MKYCTHCGAQMDDGARFCGHCGASVDPSAAQGQTNANYYAGQQPPYASAPANNASSTHYTLSLIAKIFMILACVSTASFLIPLCWTIPMTVHYWGCVRDNRPVGTAFKICSLIFVSLVAGILMLCDSNDN